MVDSPFIQKIRDINAIIEKDATDTTYKYALLRGLAEICQKYNHFKEEEKGRIFFPTGLLVEKWLFYYYPIIASNDFIPQKGGEKPLKFKKNNISFRKYFTKITHYYEDKGGFSVFYNNYKKANIPDEVQADLKVLARSILSTIKQYPMRHLGYSLNHTEYSIIKPEKGKPITKEITPRYLIESCGRFSIDSELYEVFRLFGAYFSGRQSVVNKWAEFTANADKKKPLKIELAYKILNEIPSTEREVQEARHFYEALLIKRGSLECVWSGKSITKSDELEIDHVLPFSIWLNNDLWNLLPTHKSVNYKKLNRIPSEAILLRRKETIQNYWKILEAEYPERFKNEVLISLIGKVENDPFSKILEICQFLVNYQGYQEWNVN